jgi:hypothetical protein
VGGREHCNEIRRLIEELSAGSIGHSSPLESGDRPVGQPIFSVSEAGHVR